MNGSARAVAAWIFIVCAGVSAGAQINYRPTPPPLVTADAESWYLAGTPVMFEGNIYYPAGPQIYFLPTEMVRSGFFRGIPLYTRTTIEAFSIVYVPLAGALMQPYERRREGELAGTVGSSTPMFPVAVATESPVELEYMPLPDYRQPDTYGAVGTAGMTAGAAGSTAVDPSTTRWPVPAVRRGSVNSIFIRFDGRRWFSEGAPVRFDASRMARAGEHEGMAVYASADKRTIYVPVLRGSSDFVTPYRTSRGSR